jgi:hypothetical protein
MAGKQTPGSKKPAREQKNDLKDLRRTKRELSNKESNQVTGGEFTIKKTTDQSSPQFFRN